MFGCCCACLPPCRRLELISAVALFGIACDECGNEEYDAVLLPAPYPPLNTAERSDTDLRGLLGGGEARSNSARFDCSSTDRYFHITDKTELERWDGGIYLYYEGEEQLCGWREPQKHTRSVESTYICDPYTGSPMLHKDEWSDYGSQTYFERDAETGEVSSGGDFPDNWWGDPETFWWTYNWADTDGISATYSETSLVITEDFTLTVFDCDGDPHYYPMRKRRTLTLSAKQTLLECKAHLDDLLGHYALSATEKRWWPTGWADGGDAFDIWRATGEVYESAFKRFGVTCDDDAVLKVVVRPAWGPNGLRVYAIGLTTEESLPDAVTVAMRDMRLPYYQFDTFGGSVLVERKSKLTFGVDEDSRLACLKHVEYDLEQEEGFGGQCRSLATGNVSYDKNVEYTSGASVIFKPEDIDEDYDSGTLELRVKCVSTSFYNACQSA
jgi:hypothetical protein